MRFDRILVLNPPNPPGYVSNKDSMGGFGQLYPSGAPPFPPLDIPYLIAYLSAQGLETDVIESGALGLSTVDVCARVKAKSAGRRMLVMVRTSLPTIDF